MPEVRCSECICKHELYLGKVRKRDLLTNHIPEEWYKKVKEALIKSRGNIGGAFWLNIPEDYIALDGLRIKYKLNL